MASLIQTVMDALPTDATSKLAGILGETPASITKGLGAAAPALLAAALQRSATPAGANDLLAMVNQATTGGNPLDRVGALVSDDAARSGYLSKGQDLASSLLGGATGPLTSALGGLAGMGGAATTSALAFLAPLVLGAIGRAAGPAPTASRLQSLLREERPGIVNALPPALGRLFGFTSPVSPSAAPVSRGFGRYLPWVIGAIVLLALLFAVRQCGSKQVAPPPVPPLEAPAMPSVKLPPVVSLKLPGGGTINVAEGSIGYGVAKFLESAEPAPKTFLFDNLNYDTASNALTPESQPTVASLVAILKAYPSVQARVVGYTDNQGDPAANKTLSDARAATVKAELVKGGVAASRIETAGMGELDPVADNATEDGRAKNRRTELVIVKK